jgi:predicted Zn-dependent protease
VTIDRAGRQIAVDLIGAPACRSRFQISIDELDAFGTDTIWVKLSSAMVDFAKTPDALAAVMAHELAHNVLGHRKAGIGADARRAQELAADRLAPYLMAGAGYDPAAAVVLYRRFKAKRLGGLFTSPTYPGWGQRVRAIEAEVARIAELRAYGEPVLPPVDLRPR